MRWHRERTSERDLMWSYFDDAADTFGISHFINRCSQICIFFVFFFFQSLECERERNLVHFFLSKLQNDIFCSSKMTFFCFLFGFFSIEFEFCACA